MTDNPFAALLRDVPRYDGYGTFDPDGDVVRLSEVLAALAAAVPADLTEVGNVLEGVTGNAWRIHRIASLNVETTDGRSIASCAGYSDNRRMAEVNEESAANARFIAWCREGVPALLVRIAAQEAQIKGLEAEAAATDDLMAADSCRIAALETALAAMTKERDELRACIAWVDEVYPERIEAGGAGIHITWGEFNAMQAAIGVTVDKRIGGPEGKAAHNHRLRAALVAERAKVAKLVEAATGLLSAVDTWAETPPGSADEFASTGPLAEAAEAVRAAITEAGQ